MIEVAVIGAGSAGLVTAKHLLASGLRCCVFESAATLGGAWTSSGEQGIHASEAASLSAPASVSTSATTSTTTPMWRGLRTNLSKHTCRFSDFPWPEDTPTFPSKEDMDWYLKAYAKEFLLDNDGEAEFDVNDENGGGGDPMCSFRYDCRVTKISPIGNTLSSIDGNANIDGNFNNDANGDVDGCANNPDQRYRVEWTDSVAQTQHSKEFGGVVLATGFFSKPKYPSGLLPELERRSNLNNISDNENENHPMEILHSKDYSCHEQFQFQPDQHQNQKQTKKIVIVGSSHSALEIAVDLTKSAEQPVTVIMPRIPWVVPRYVPVSSGNNNNNNSDGFLPIDLAFYRRTHDRGAREETETTVLTPESCRKKNEHLRALLGPRQDRILPVSETSFDNPPMVAISDLFLDLVEGGRIQVLNGRLEGLTQDGNGLQVSRSMKHKNDGERDTATDTDTFEVEVEVVSGVTSLICCTGYSPDLESCIGGIGASEGNSEDTTNEEKLPPGILDTIRYDPTDTFSPMTTFLETLHPQLPNLAFVGMYRGPYMGIVELQARLASEHIGGKSQSQSHAPLTREDLRKGLETSEAIRHQDPLLRPQFPRFDYVGFLDSLAGSLSPEPGFEFPTEHLDSGAMVTPAFYQPDPRWIEAAKTELRHEIEKGSTGHHLPGIVTSALVGDWSFERNIVHFAKGGKTIAQQQYIHGTVNYSRSRDHGHVLYREDGLFKISPDKSLPVFREYEYICNYVHGESDGDDKSGAAMELYFVENGARTYLFLSLQFQNQDKDGYWVATNDHLCVKDLYKANFRVKLDGLAATEVIITYRVQGPSKDYESTTTMRPR